MFLTKVSLIALFALFVSASPESPVGELSHPAIQGSDSDLDSDSGWTIMHTCYNARVRVNSRKLAKGTYSFRAFNYAPNSLGTAFPVEHQSYVTQPIGGGGIVVDGTAFPFVWDSQLGMFTCTATFPTRPGSQYSVDVLIVDNTGNLIFSDSLNHISISS
jgi:hypothetical protein